MTRQDVNASATIPDAHFAGIPDPLSDGNLICAARRVVERRAIEADGPTSRPD